MISKEIFTLKVCVPVPISTNEYYRTRHTTNINRAFYQEVMLAVANARADGSLPYDVISTYPIELHFDFFLLGRLFDSMNLSAMGKCIEDGLRHRRVIKDDSPKYVRKVSFISHKCNEKLPYAVVTARVADVREGGVQTYGVKCRPPSHTVNLTKPIIQEYERN